MPAGQVLQIGTDSSGRALGLHPRLTGLQSIFNQGRLAIVQRTGYQNSSRSHFQGFDIWGTDVGVMWDNGIPDDPNTPVNEHQVLIAVGDTFGDANMTGYWRNNTILRSGDMVLGDGMSIPDGEWFNGNMFGGAPLNGPKFSGAIASPHGEFNRPASANSCSRCPSRS